MNRRFAPPVVAALALTACFGSLAPPAASEAIDGAQVGQWKTWVLTSGSEISVPAPPAENSDQTKAELAELRRFQTERGAMTNTAIQHYSGAPATKVWTNLAQALSAQSALNTVRDRRVQALVHTAMYDAVVATWAAKYTYNRRPPSQVATDLSPVITLAGEAQPAEPSYPSEHAAVALAAVTTLAYLFPDAAATLQATAMEAGESRMQAGLNYRSDVEAGYAIGTTVGQKAVARAEADGSNAPWTGTVPTGPGLWVGQNPVEPLAGTWKPWVLTSGSQFRPGPPPAFGTPEFAADLDVVKRINANPSPSQRALAVFWGQQSGGFWERTAYELMARDSAGTPTAARIMALHAVTQMDATIAVFDARYTYWRIRPNQADPTIQVLFKQSNHPAYPAFGSVLNVSAGEVLAYAFPQDAARLRYLGEEGALSRIYPGFHYPSDVEAATQLAHKIVALSTAGDRLNSQ